MVSLFSRHFPFDTRQDTLQAVNVPYRKLRWSGLSRQGGVKIELQGGKKVV